MADDAWETLRFVTMDQLVTATKLHGSAQTISGHTTPEGWPFVVVVAVAKPGNERAVEYAREFARRMEADTAWTLRANHPTRKPPV